VIPVVPAQPARVTVDPSVGEVFASNLKQIESERKNRPTPMQTPRAEAVLDELERLGIKVGGRSQFMAKTVHALYCFGGDLAEGRQMIVVCEYPDEQSAQKGRALRLEQSGAVRGLEVFVNRKTMLTLYPDWRDSAASAALAQKVKTIFLGL
jgi:hypothetical protein